MSMIKLEGNDRSQIISLFKDYTFWRTFMDLVLYQNMGLAIADRPNPKMAVLFFSGAVVYGGKVEPEVACDLVKQLPVQPMVLGSDPEWYKYLKAFEFAQRTEKQRFYHPSNSLNFEKTHRLSKQAIPGYTIRRIEPSDDQELFEKLGWEHQRYHYKDMDQFVTDGLGYCAVQNHTICAAVSCFARYRNEAEIQITTHVDHRRKGLAQALAARFILDCQNKGIECPWDATDEASANLANKLGYSECKEYPILEIQV